MPETCNLAVYRCIAYALPLTIRDVTVDIAQVDRAKLPRAPTLFKAVDDAFLRLEGFVRN